MVKIYSVGVWNKEPTLFDMNWYRLKFTPLEFETRFNRINPAKNSELKFTPLEFETVLQKLEKTTDDLLKFTPLEFETQFNEGFLSFMRR